MRFRDNIPLYILAVLTVLSVSASYVRFVVAKDYIVAYEGVCDPATQSCFARCEDDACIDKSYYTKVRKYAANLYAQCGKDITNCDVADSCLSQGDQKCSVTYCDPKTEGDDACATSTEEVSTAKQDTNL